MRATTWEHVDERWHDRLVTVRWETAGSVTPSRRPSWLAGGRAHVLVGVVEYPGGDGVAPLLRVEHGDTRGTVRYVPPSCAHVKATR